MKKFLMLFVVFLIGVFSVVAEPLEGIFDIKFGMEKNEVVSIMNEKGWKAGKEKKWCYFIQKKKRNICWSRGKRFGVVFL